MGTQEYHPTAHGFDHYYGAPMTQNECFSNIRNPGSATATAWGPCPFFNGSTGDAKSIQKRSPARSASAIRWASALTSGKSSSNCDAGGCVSAGSEQRDDARREYGLLVGRASGQQPSAHEQLVEGATKLLRPAHVHIGHRERMAQVEAQEVLVERLGQDD